MKIYERNFKNPNTLEGAVLICNNPGENNFVVAAYMGSEGGTPYLVERGGREYARNAWKAAQDRLLSQGFQIVS